MKRFVYFHCVCQKIPMLFTSRGVRLPHVTHHSTSKNTKFPSRHFSCISLLEAIGRSFLYRIHLNFNDFRINRFRSSSIHSYMLWYISFSFELIINRRFTNWNGVCFLFYFIFALFIFQNFRDYRPVCNEYAISTV